MKICFVFRDSGTGGTSIEEIFHGLFTILKRNHNVVSFEYKKRKSLFTNIISLLGSKATIYHITGDVYFLSYFMWWRRIILTIHDIGRFKELRGVKRIIYKEIFLRGPMFLASQITTVSQYTKDDIEKYFGHRIGRKIRVIYNPLPPIFGRDEKEFNHSRPRILQVGTTSNKNLTTVIPAVQGIDCELVIIGKLSGELLDLISRGNVNYRHFQNLTYKEVYEQYCLCDIVVFVSTHEGFGMPVLEGQVVGRAVITSRVTSLPEVAGDGVLYIDDPTCKEEITSGLKRIRDDDAFRENLIQRGFKNARRFEMSLILKEYLHVYEKVQS